MLHESDDAFAAIMAASASSRATASSSYMPLVPEAVSRCGLCADRLVHSVVFGGFAAMNWPPGSRRQAKN